MSIVSKARITAFGSYVPDRILTNEDLERMVDTSDEWIVQRTGIKERHIAADDVFTSHLCIRAAERLRETYGASLDDVDFIIAATTTPDYSFPTVSCRVQKHFGMEGAGAIDLNATCAGFTYALHMANGLISSGLHKKILVVAGETMSKITDYSDRTTCILFGDGAGAALVEYDPEQPGFEAYVMGTNGAGGIHVYRSGLADEMDGVALAGNGKLVQNGREVFKWAVRTVSAGIEQILEQAGLERGDIDWFVPHSANLRMVESICEKASLPLSKTLQSVQDMGNTSSASIPLALQAGLDAGRLKHGDRMLLYGFGGGLTHAGLILRWGVPNLRS
ncbi:MAG: ketoacyl-ACP synthase III [Paenibacillus macerans]|uniref:Beta-ketoacyl-[acyl-carrier-protein] synthase III n=1 Tax=Paenibacillus macerans TaxID=44252 RepID=A0A090Z5V4_PAEMA|nr:ketoacyl-ACP synthase III [Paenibacillus macerans]KFN05748.1 3-oxoacyl-[acyl-carrier-] synthase III family protein [Paenibacillus macerans]MBS5910207.1 ketoacyl-ACP synthase III [Paenibacillus macerans]MCY7559809.1 ketoacyl-ACP synthase III [Paenibacillus macerans]MDU7475285.1 ketoacyl-ACP synthase III [Paenibacillus macerans]MEC0140289.1 ketoacyl-ACP synthase III [Paenibacillus macerans]